MEKDSFPCFGVSHAADRGAGSKREVGAPDTMTGRNEQQRRVGTAGARHAKDEARGDNSARRGPHNRAVENSVTRETHSEGGTTRGRKRRRRGAANGSRNGARSRDRAQRRSLSAARGSPRRGRYRGPTTPSPLPRPRTRKTTTRATPPIDHAHRNALDDSDYHVDNHAFERTATTSGAVIRKNPRS